MALSNECLAACGPRFLVFIVRAGRGGAGFRALRSATKALPLESAIFWLSPQGKAKETRVKLYLCNLSISVAFIDTLTALKDSAP